MQNSPMITNIKRSLFHVLPLTVALSQAACSITASGSAGPASVTSQEAMLGTWVSNCVSAGMDYMKQTMVIDSATYTTTTLIYSDSACTQQSPATVPVVSGSYFLQGEDVNEMDAMDLRITYQDQNNQTQTGYTMILVQDSTMYMPSSIGTSAASRPTSVDRTMPFTKSN